MEWSSIYLQRTASGIRISLLHCLSSSLQSAVGGRERAEGECALNEAIRL